MPVFTSDQQWQVMDSYFKSHIYPLTKHHIDSYREFLRNYIPSIIRTFNPITMIKLDSKGEPLLTVRIFVGGENGDAIYIDRPTMIDNNRTEVLLTPAEARLRNLTYEGHLYADVKVIYELADREKDRIQTTTFPKVLLGAVPIMVHSDACILNGQGPDVLRELGECIYDTGGYFIIDGKEKVIVSQERITNNKLFIEDLTEDLHFSNRAYIKCVGQKGESKLAPRGFELYIARDKNTMPEKKEEVEGEEVSSKKKLSDYVDNAIYISFASLRGRVPLFMLFRALGVETDKEIIEMIFGTSDIPNEYIKYIRASVVAAHTKKETCYTQADALDHFKYRVQYQLIEYVKNLLVTDIFPNIENQNEKPMYLGYLVRQLLDTCLHVYPKTDRDAYTTKRIDISGFQLSGLFQEVYKSLTKNCRDLLDREYNLGPWRNNGNNRITDLVRKDNIYKLFPPAIMTERLVKSLKGMWGSTDKDTEQGKVQDLSRISYLGYLSHMRRINLPLDRARRNVPPHRLHPQQWGFFCPFETPDGQNIGLLKNFSLMSYITFGTSSETIQEYLPSLGIIPLHNTMGTRVAKKDITKVMVNGSWYGITKDPLYHTRLLKALRRNGYINPFVSISWNIRENMLHIQTDPGRMCRPLFIVQQNSIHMKHDNETNWFKYLFGDGGSYLSSDHKEVEKIFYTEEMYYKDKFMLPSWWKYPVTAQDRLEVITRLEKSQGCIEFVDVDEENTLMIAMNLTDLSAKDAKDTKYIKDYTHCEIHPSAAFSVVTNTIPFANHNYAARNLFHGAQAKQTVGVYATNFRKRFDTMAYIMHYPQKPIVTTRNAHYIASNRMPNGVNVIVAIATYTGFNQEDGIIINRSAIERGLFQSTAYKTMTATEKVISQNERLQFKNPYIYIDALKEEGIEDKFIDILREAGYTTIQSLIKEDEKKFDVKGITKKETIGIFEAANKIRTKSRDYNQTIRGVKPPESYSFLDENGIIREGSKIPRGAKVVVMGMVNILEEHREVSRGILSEIEKVRHYKDVSYMTDVHHYGTVDKVFIGTKALGSSERICKVRFRKARKPELGDKGCSRHGQKGVIGMILPEASMPMTKNGIVPDIIINPHALPSRMTIAHLVECIFAKGCCFDGAQGDGTMFIPVDYNAIGATLEEQGFNKYGNEIMYDGRTGRQIGSDIFIGPTFYYRLKHMVSDKVHARPGNPEGLPRADLPYDNLTRQPTEGRARNGGLRIGEMERDVLVSYGMSQFVKESMMDRSDRYRYGVCRHCGIISTPGKNRKTFTCSSCKSNDTAIVETPYAWKLLLQEFEALGIEMRYVMEDIPIEMEEDFMLEEDLQDEEAEEAEEAEEDEEDYQHNQDLDEPAVYGTEEHIQYGGLNEVEDIKTIDLSNNSQNNGPTSDVIQPAQPAQPAQPVNDINQKQTNLALSPSSSSSITDMSKNILNEPVIPLEKPVLQQHQMIVKEQSGGNQMLDLDDMGVTEDDFFKEFQDNISNNNNFIKGGKPLAREVKTIILGGNLLKYKGPSLKTSSSDEYNGGGYEDGVESESYE